MSKLRLQFVWSLFSLHCGSRTRKSCFFAQNTMTSILFSENHHITLHYSLVVIIYQSVCLLKCKRREIKSLSLPRQQPPIFCCSAPFFEVLSDITFFVYHPHKSSIVNDVLYLSELITAVANNNTDSYQLA